MEKLPTAVAATILSKLDVASICAVASTSKTLRASAFHLLTFLPWFHLVEIAPPLSILTPLLSPKNPFLKSLRLDCDRLDDSSLDLLLRPSLSQLSLHNCSDFTGRLLSQIGHKCTHLRYLYLDSVAEKRRRSMHVSDLEELLRGCTQLEALILMCDVSLFLHHNFARVWALACEKLTSLEIGYIYSGMVTELLSPGVGTIQSPDLVLPGIQKLCLSVDFITDSMVSAISRRLKSLTYLDLRDAPFTQPTLMYDLTNSGLQQINQHGKLKHLSLVRSQEFLITYFTRVNDLGMLLLADKCANIESIRLGGFCRVTDTGFKTILHSCHKLYKFRVSHGTHLTDLVFHDISATSLSLMHVSLRRCNLLTSHAIINVAQNTNLQVLDLKDCKSLGDEALRAIGALPELKTLLLEGLDVTDSGLAYLRGQVIGSLVSLSLRGCKRLTDKCIPILFEECRKLELQHLDLSNLPYLSDIGVLSLAKHRVPISELRMRQCPLIGDTSVMALASMQVDDEILHGSSLRLLDLYNCGSITQLSFRWLKKPYFPRLRWLGVTGCVNRDIVDALARSRPFLRVACGGEELGVNQWDDSESSYVQMQDEVDELEEWLYEYEGENNDVEMVDAENNEPME